MRKRGRVDNIQTDAVKALRTMGASVAIISSVGGGVPDLIVGYRGRTYLVELKTDDAPLTADETAFAGKWAGQLYVARSPKDAVIKILEASKQ